MLDQFAAQHRVERLVGVRINMLLGVEMVDVAFEDFAVSDTIDLWSMRPSGP